jgi:hypothetical protein
LGDRIKQRGEDKQKLNVGTNEKYKKIRPFERIFCALQ